MTHKHQRGWLKKEKRSQGETWVLFFLRFGNPTVSEWRTTFQLALSKTSPAKAVHGGRSKDNISTSTRWISADVQHLRIWHITTRNMSSSNPPNPSIRRHTRQSEVTNECSAIGCCHTGGTESRSASNRWRWNNG